MPLVVTWCVTLRHGGRRAAGRAEARSRASAPKDMGGCQSEGRRWLVTALVYGPWCSTRVACTGRLGSL